MDQLICQGLRMHCISVGPEYGNACNGACIAPIKIFTFFLNTHLFSRSYKICSSLVINLWHHNACL